MYRLKEKIDFDFESGKWKVPPFLVKAKEVAFPKIGLMKSMNLVAEQKDQRDIVMADSGEVLDGENGSSASGTKYGGARNGITNTFKSG